jgi:hypothetical protein
MVYKVITVPMAAMVSQMRENSLIHGQVALFSAGYLHSRDRVHLSPDRNS